jgi:hypothetical protein
MEALPRLSEPTPSTFGAFASFSFSNRPHLRILNSTVALQ